MPRPATAPARASGSRRAWEHRNLFPPEGALRIAAIAGTAEQNSSVRFRRNNWGQRDRALLLQFDIGARDFEAFQGYTTRLYGLISRESTPIWQKRWTYAYGAEILATNENRNGTAKISLSDAYFIGGLIGQIGYDRSNSLLDPTRGFRLLARVNPEASLRNGADFYIRNLDRRQRLLSGRRELHPRRAGAVRLDLRHPARPDRAVAAALCGRRRLGARLRLSGAGPARPQQRAARRAQSVRASSRSRAATGSAITAWSASSTRARCLRRNIPTFSDMRFGVGIGGRVYTNFGPVRVDVATPIGRRAGEALITVYVSIGQAF